MFNNVNTLLEREVQKAPDLAALKGAVLHITSSVVNDMQNIERRRLAEDQNTSNLIRRLEGRINNLEYELDQLKRRLR